MKDIKRIFFELTKEPVYSVQVGKTTGSIIVLDFVKDKISWSLMIYCTWRLDCDFKRKPITGWNESNDIEDKTMAYQIKKLSGDVVTKASLNAFGDIILRFESKKTLKVFCDITQGIKEDCIEYNWILFDYSQNTCYSHQNSFVIERSLIQP